MPFQFNFLPSIENEISIVNYTYLKSFISIHAYLRDTMGSVLDYQNETSIAMESNLFASEGPCLQFVKKYICEVQ